MMASEEYDDLFKGLLIGDSGSGKSGLFDRFIKGVFQDSYSHTIGVDFGVKIFRVGGRRVKIQLWDSGGRERFAFVRPLYYRGASGCILVFDVTNRESFDHIPNWIEELELNAGKIPSILVGNKIDSTRSVAFDEARALCSQLKIPFYYESSAKDGIAVDEIFSGIAYLMMNDTLACEKEAARLKAKYDAREKAEREARKKADVVGQHDVAGAVAGACLAPRG
jgi:Ras-related protein Rab-1A